MSMQLQMENERKKYTDQITSLELLNKKKEEEIKQIKENLLSKKSEDDFGNKLIAELNGQIRQKEKEISEKNEENKNLNDKISLKNKNILELEMDKKNLNEKIKILESQIYMLQKKLNGLEEEKKNMDKKIDEKDKDIEQLNKNIEKIEENNKSLLIYIKDFKEKEELLKKEKEELRINQEKIREKKIRKKENEKDEKNDNDNSKEKPKIFEGQEKIIIDLLCEFLLKLNNSQYFISVFDLLNKSCKQFEELKFFYKLNSSRHESMNEILFNFFDSINSYFSIAKNKATLNDFLQQKSFKISKLEKDDIDIIKIINSIKIGKNMKILDIYLKKKEHFFKSKEFTFNLLKEKILNSQENDYSIKNYGKKEKNEEKRDIFLNITAPPLELEVNFDKLFKQDYALVKYQVDNVFSKLKELTLQVSKFPIFLLYSLTVNCQNLLKLKIEYIKNKESSEINKKNIEIMSEICPKLIVYLKEMISFSLINLPLQTINLPDISAALKNSKIQKLSLINCFKTKDDLIQLIPYFSLPNSLKEIDLSNNNLSIPTVLGTTLINYNINKNLTSINFSNCGLNEADIKYITNYIVESNSLLVCDIGKNILSPLSCSTFGYCILKTNSLETLKLNQCGINGESLLFLFNGKGSKPLKNINLNGNEFGDIGLVSLCAFMKASPSLESIELEKCGGTDMGFKSLVNTIQKNNKNKMKYVNFQKNIITDISLDILKNFNDYFKKKKVVFAIDKKYNDEDNYKYEDIDCVIFN
jgi:hypothetical protein